MDLYTAVSYKLSRQLTLKYSTSFGISSLLFGRTVRRHIFAIYGLARIADEVVDTYRGVDALSVLDSLESNTLSALKSGYSTNPIIHSFAVTAIEYDIKDDLIAPFFASMRIDATPNGYSQDMYKEYIHGSAEVIGLMCLRVFCNNNQAQYKKLEQGAAALGAAYQKVNFLRDLAADYKELGRVYFPGVTFESFDIKTKQKIIRDIESDLKKADKAIRQLPRSSRVAVQVSRAYYGALLGRLENASAEHIKKSRIRVSDIKKSALLVAVVAREGLRK
jgi:phytoene synthase